MNYSSTHKWFANNLYSEEGLNKQDVLDHPENYLGPNYKEVLNWWFYWDSLSGKQKNVYYQRYRELSEEAHMEAEELATEVIDSTVASYLDFYELELVAAHLYIEREIPFTFLPLTISLNM